MDIVTYVLAKNSANSAIATAIAALPKGLIYRGAVSYVSDLPNNAEIGDCYTIKYKGTSGTTADGHEVAWGNYEGTPQWIDFGGGGSSITVDDVLSDSSENPVQNKIIAKDVGELKSALDTIVRSVMINDTASGSIASFPDGADGIPVKDLTVAVEPVQDLHGYNNPWPAGGGKNLLWMNNGIFKTGAFSNTTPRETTGVGTWVGISSSNYLAPNNITSYTIGDNSLTVTATANGYGVGFECKLTAGQQYTLSWVGTNAYIGISFYDGNGEYLSYITSGVSPKTFTVPESTANAIIVLRGEGANVTGEFSNIQLEEGQTATAYSPYANICPISGWTGANVTRTGKNLFDPTTFSSRSNYYDVNDDGSVKIKASDSSGWNSAPIIPLKAGTYTLSINDYTSGNYQVETSEDNYTSPTHKRYDAAFTFTLTKDGGIKVKMGTGGATLPQTVKPILNIGYTAASYSPYVGNSYTITFPSEAGTVYGGTLDVTTGKLMVDRAYAVFDGSSDENWRMHGTIASWFYTDNAFTNVFTDTSASNFSISNAYKQYPYSTVANIENGKFAIGYSSGSEVLRIVFKDTRYTTVQEWTDEVATNHIQLCYKLATPIVYDLTPTEVKTLLAQNNIWADCGDSTVNYFADTKLYIDKKIAALAAAMN